MKYNFVEAIEMMVSQGQIMHIEGTDIYVFYTDTYAYFKPDDQVVETGKNYILYKEPKEGCDIDYKNTTIEFLTNSYKHKEWTIKEM